MATEAKESESKSGMSKEDKAFLMKAVWKALQSPTWTKDDLIAFGKAIFSKQTLSQMPEKVFEGVYTFLSTITDSLGEQLAKEADTHTARANGKVEKDEKAEKDDVLEDDEEDEEEKGAEAPK
jgi:hypothetical protein